MGIAYKKEHHLSGEKSSNYCVTKKLHIYL